MARLIPKIDPSLIQNSGERIVAQALVEQLPSNCLIYHSFPWLRPQRHEKNNVPYLQPGEADFVIVHPDLGILVLEVKGGGIEYDPISGEWVRTDTWSGRQSVIQDPFLQAERNKYALLDRIQEHELFRGSGAPSYTIGHAVVFPDSRYEGQLPAHVQGPILFGADDIKFLNKKVVQAFEAWCRVRNQYPFRPHELDAITEALSPIFRLTPVLWRTIDDQEERLKRLTDSQALLLEALRNQKRAAIEGVAGSGKTILAVAQAQRFARVGKRTLLVCYNRPLADWLNQQIPDKYHSLIHIYSFHHLCREMCRVTKLNFPASSYNQDFWDIDAPSLLEHAASKVGSEFLFDAIVVDEGQDFHELWWIALKSLYRDQNEQGPFYVFFDPKQNIYLNQPTIPAELGVPFVLPTNCRNTRRIAEYCADIVGIDASVHEDAPLGGVPNVTEAGTLKEVIEQTRQTVQNWCLTARGGMQPRQVAILTATNNPDKWPNAFGHIKLVTDFDQWRSNIGVLLSTQRRFKGLEADSIVLAGVPHPDRRDFYSFADHYVATSRAKHILEVIFDNSL